MKKKYYKQIFLTYIIIAFSLTMTLFIFICGKGMKSYEQNLDGDNAIHLYKLKENMDSKIQINKSICNQLMVYDEFYKYCYSEVNDYYNILKVHKKIADITNSYSPIGCEVYIIKNESSIVITPDSTMDIDDFYGHMGLMLDKRDKIKEFMASNTKFDKRSLMLTSELKTGEKIFTVINKLSNYNNLAVFVTYPVSGIFDLSGIDSGFYVITDMEKTIVSSNDNVSNELLGILETEEIERNDKLEKYGLRGYYIYQIASEQENLMYMFFSSKSIYAFGMMKIVIRYLLICLILIVLEYLVIRRFSDKLYKPINEIMGLLGMDKYSYEDDEISRLKASISDLKRDNIEMTETVSSYKRQNEDILLRNIIERKTDTQTIQTILKAYNCEWMKDDITLVLLEIPFITENADITSKVKRILTDRTKNKLSKLFPIKIVPYSDTRYILIIKCESDEKIGDHITDVILSVEEETGICAVAVMVGYCKDIEAAHLKIAEALNVLNFRDKNERKIIYTLGDKSVNSINYSYPVETEMNIIESVFSGDCERLGSHIQDLRDLNKNIQLDDKKRLSLILSYSATIQRILQKLDKNSDDIFMKGESPYSELSMCEDFGSLTSKFHEFLDMIAKRVKADNSIDDSDKAQEMIKYVSENFYKDLSLTDMGQHFNLSAGYISTLFKRYTGENFKDYLTKCRIRYAKELLIRENISVKDISVRCGFTSSQSFIRAFNRYENMSPGKYAKTYKK